MIKSERNLVENNKKYKYYSTKSHFISVPQDFVVLYADPNIIRMEYICGKQNVSTGICDEPLIYINVRVRPDDLLADDKAYIDETINSVLKPYCVKAEDIPLQSYLKTRPLCSIAAPACFEAKVKGLAASVQ